MGYKNLDSSSRNKEKPVGSRSGNGGGLVTSHYAVGAISGPRVIKKGPGATNAKQTNESREVVQIDTEKFDSGYDYEGNYPTAKQ
jgi:hypothetical protein